MNKNKIYLTSKGARWDRTEKMLGWDIRKLLGKNSVKKGFDGIRRIKCAQRIGY